MNKEQAHRNYTIKDIIQNHITSDVSALKDVLLRSMAHFVKEHVQQNVVDRVTLILEDAYLAVQMDGLVKYVIRV